MLHHFFVKVSILFFLLFSYTISIQAQEIFNYRRLAQTLCSDSLYGRGYVRGGCDIAAQLIAEEFSKLSLSKFQNSYFQSFSFPVNTIIQTNIVINGQLLTPGKDYLVDAASRTFTGKFTIKKLSYIDFLSGIDLSKIKLSKNEILFIDKIIPTEEMQKKEINKIIEQQIRKNISTLKCMIINTDEKLTWSVSSEVMDGTIIILNNFQSEIKLVEIDIKNYFFQKYKTSNIIGFIPGKNTDSTIVLTAHYDHLGMMGNAIFPGANDNASGVCMLLTLAQYFKAIQPAYSIVFIAFGGEEVGLLGSGYFVQNPTLELNKIKFMWNFDLAGTGDEGIQVVNSKIETKEIKLLFSINDSLKLLPEIKKRGPACNSDHCFFAQKGIPSYYSYTLGGSKAYHDIFDSYSNLSFLEFEDYFTLMKLLIENY